MGTAHEFEVSRGSLVVNYVLSSQGISRAARYRRKAIKWHEVKTLWTLKNSFILFYSDTGYWVLPQDQIPQDAKDFIRQEIKSAGARVKTLGSWRH